MILEFQEKTGVFPSSARELERVGASEEDIALAERDYLFTSRLGAGIVFASAKNLRVSLALLRFKTMALALLDDGSVCRVRGTLVVDSFRDKLWALERRSDVGHFFQVGGKLRFRRGTGYGKTLAPLALVLSVFFVPLIPLLYSIMVACLLWTPLGESQIFLYVLGFFLPFFFSCVIGITIILFFLGVASAFWRLKADLSVRRNSVGEERGHSRQKRLKTAALLVFLVVEFLVLLTAAASAMIVEAYAGFPDFANFFIIEGILSFAAIGIPLPSQFYTLVASILGFA